MKKLLVEGKHDTHVVTGVMGKYVLEWPVTIKGCGGIEGLLEPSLIPTYLKGSGLSAVGVILDADAEFESKWRRLRARCLGAFPDLPCELPGEGLIHIREGLPRFGAWVMPDNGSPGTLETFLGALVPDDPGELWGFAENATREAKSHGAPYKHVHVEKAVLRSWLAWQNPPGNPFGTALKAGALDAKLPAGRLFAAWVIKLFELDPIPGTFGDVPLDDA